MAQLGFRTVDEMVGRVRLHRARGAPACTRRRASSTSREMLYRPKEAATGAAPLRRSAGPQARRACSTTSSSPQAKRAHRDAATPVRHRDARSATRDRAFGAMLERRDRAPLRRATGLPDDTIRIARHAAPPARASAPSPSPGMTLELEGDANDYVGKGLSGGILAVRPPPRVAVPRRRPRHRRQHRALRRHQRARLLQRARRRALRGAQQRRDRGRRGRGRSRLRVHDRRHRRRARHHRAQLRAPA